MTPDSKPSERKSRMIRRAGASDTIYGLGLIGAWAYFMGRALTPRQRLLAFFKGLFWPAILVYELLKFLEVRPSAPLPPPASSQPAPSQAPAPAAVRTARKTAQRGRAKKKAVRK